MTHPPPILSMHAITKTYPGVRAVDDVTFDVRGGEVHGLVGENGAGKSTLIKILAGAVHRDRGEIHFDGQPVEIATVHDAKRLGVSIIHQELNLVPYFDGAENIFLGDPYPHRWYGGGKSPIWAQILADAHPEQGPWADMTAICPRATFSPWPPPISPTGITGPSTMSCTRFSAPSILG